MDFSQYDEIFVMWSGGKDSTASLIKCYELGVPVTAVVISKVMFDKKNNISGEHPLHDEFINTAINFIENTFHYKVIVLIDKSDFLTEFNSRIGSRSKHPERIGKKRGFFLSGMCIGNDRLKLRPIRKFLKNHNNCLQIVGIAHDEKDRLEKNTMIGKFSILDYLEINEKDTYSICNKYNLLSPIYKYFTRGGCWFCPNSSIKELAFLKKYYPLYYNYLLDLSKDTELVTPYFSFGKTFSYLDKQVDLFNSQLSIFDFL